MKRIRNRKFLKAKRVQYSLLLRVYRMSMQEFFQTASELKDEAEFEARVAAKLARWNNEYHKDDHLCPYGDDELDNYIPMCHCTDFCKDHPKLGCIAVKLAWARLQVEEEMDGN